MRNIDQQLKIRGEYSNPDQEMLFEWIKTNTKQDSVFGGSMPVMANLKLSTNRPIVNHPHYEHEEIRLGVAGCLMIRFEESYLESVLDV